MATRIVEEWTSVSILRFGTFDYFQKTGRAFDENDFCPKKSNMLSSSTWLLIVETAIQGEPLACLVRSDFPSGR